MTGRAFSILTPLRNGSPPFQARARRMALVAMFGLALAAYVTIDRLLSWTLDARRELGTAEQAIRRQVGGGQPNGEQTASAVLARRVLRGASTADVQAGIQSAVKSVADAHRLRIETIQLLTPQRVGDLTRLSVRVSGSVDEAQFGDVLIGLANHAPVIGVQSLDARSQPPRAALVGGDKEPPQLAVSLVLTAFALTPTADRRGPP